MTAYALQNVEELPSDVQIVIRMYSDQQSLAQKCAIPGVAGSAQMFNEFVYGLTCEQPLFDFVDIGTTPLGAFDKIAGKHRGGRCSNAAC